MAVFAGSIRTRVLVVVGGTEPTEICTFTTDLHPLTEGTGVTLSTRRWRRDLMIACVRMAWAVLTMRRA